MHLIGRWAKVRPLGPQGWGQPYMLDQKWGRLLPYEHPQWWRSPDGLWIPVIEGGIVGTSGLLQRPRWQVGILADVGHFTRTFGTNYVAGTSGTASGARISLPVQKTLQDVYWCISSYTGNAALVTTLDFELRTGTSSGPTTSAGGLVETITGVNPSSATGWIKVTGWSSVLSAKTLYFLIAGDADGNGTNNAVVYTYFGNVLSWHDWMAVYTANGFVSTSRVAYASISALVCDDGTVYGCPFNARSTPAPGALQYGFYIDGVRSPVKLFGLLTSSGCTNMSGCAVYPAAEAPDGTPITNGSATDPFVGNTTTFNFARFTTPPTLDALTPYRIVYTFSSSATRPGYYSIGTGADANLRSLMVGGGGWYKTEEVAGPAWSDDQDSFPEMALLLEDIGTTDAGDGGVDMPDPLIVGA